VSATSELIELLKEWSAQFPWTRVLSFYAYILLFLGVGYVTGRQSSQANEGLVWGFIRGPFAMISSLTAVAVVFLFIQFVLTH